MSSSLNLKRLDQPGIKFSIKNVCFVQNSPSCNVIYQEWVIGFFSSPSDRRWSRRPLSDLRGMTRDRELSVVVVMHRAPSLSLGLASSSQQQQQQQQLVLLALQRAKSSGRQAGRMVSSLSFLLSRYFGSHCLRITKETHFRRRQLDYLIEWATAASQLKQLAGEEQTAFCKMATPATTTTCSAALISGATYTWINVAANGSWPRKVAHLDIGF